LGWLRELGLEAAIVERARRGAPLLGVCGGCEMLGESIDDRDGVEAGRPVVERGMGLLPLRTRFESPKVTARVEARSLGRGFLCRLLPADLRIDGYEIHMGRVEATRDDVAPFEMTRRGGNAAREPDGAVDERGAVVGTMIHGLFENDALRRALLRELRRRKGLPEPVASVFPSKDSEYDRLAGVLRESLDAGRLRRIVGL
jgi:adenosylcobyric acid synthase